MRKKIYIFIVILICLADIVYSGETIKMATTTSTDNSGLLDYLLPEFTGETGITIQVIAAGTGKAIALGRAGDVDLVFVHARSAEDEFVRSGYGINRRNVMYNDFVILGPKTDPAGIYGLSDPLEALRKIKNAKCVFVSRGDYSGTDKKEKTLWRELGAIPSGPWYLETGQGMGSTLTIADEKEAYLLADRGTYIAFKKKISLLIMCTGDKRLLNPYGIIAVNPDKHPHVHYHQALTFIDWITSVKGQEMIGNFKKEGEMLFYPNVQ